MKNLSASIAMICITLIISAFSIDSGKALTGIWNFTIQDVPQGYNEGHISFEEKEGILQGKMVTENGAFPMQKLKVTNDSITYDVTVQSVTLQALLLKSGDTLSGKIMTPEGDLTIKAARQTGSQP